MFKLLRDSRGFSLVEVLIGFAMAGGLALVLVNLSEQQNKQNKKAMTDAEGVEILTQFNTMISRKSSCDATFFGQEEGTSLAEFRYNFDENADPYAQTRRRFRNTKFVLVSMQILKDEDEVVTDGSKHYEVYPLVSKVSDADGDGYYETPAVIKGTTANAPSIKVQPGIVVVEVIFQKPSGTLGGDTVTKYYDVPAQIGEGSPVFSNLSKEDVRDQCIGDGTSGKCIATDEYECASDDKALDYIEGEEGMFYGICFDPKSTSTTDRIILHCKTSK